MIVSNETLPEKVRKKCWEQEKETLKPKQKVNVLCLRESPFAFFLFNVLNMKLEVFILCKGAFVTSKCLSWDLIHFRFSQQSAKPTIGIVINYLVAFALFSPTIWNLFIFNGVWKWWKASHPNSKKGDKPWSCDVCRTMNNTRWVNE